MTTITIANDVPAHTVAKIQEVLDETALRDVNWNGVNFQIERGDFTYIDNDESTDAVKILHKINDIIAGK